MYGIIFLWVLALVYISFAVVQDLKTREIANWISFSLIIFALGFRFLYSLFENDGFSFFYNGLIGFGIFFVLGNLFYYGRIFAGGDAKLMIALGTILPYSSNFFSNIQVFFNFLLPFFSVGFIYILIASSILCLKNFDSFKRELSKQLNQKKKITFVVISLSLFFLILGFLQKFFLLTGVLIFVVFYLLLYSIAVDRACMVKKIKTKKLREGDWLFSNLRIRKKVIKAKWDGLTKEDIKEIRKRYNEVKIRGGIPFSPVFLISFILFIILTIFDIKLWNPFW